MKIAAGVLYAFFAASLTSNQAGRMDREQLVFNAMTKSVQHPVALPSDVLAMLARQPDIAALVDSVAPGQLPSSWFLASEVHLGGPAERDLVVIGVGPVRGANVTTFWVFRPKGFGHELLLDGAPALQLTIKSARTNGYRDIELSSATAVAVSTVGCKFRGGVYQKAKPKVSALK